MPRRSVAYDAATATLTVGARSVAVHCAPGDNECLLRTYLDLVAEQRDVPVDRAVHLRHDDVVVLAQLLDLDDDALEFRLRRLLFLSERQAAALARRLRRNRVALAVGLGVLTAVPAVSALAGADRVSASPPSTGTFVAESTTSLPSTPTTAAPTTIIIDVPAPAAPTAATATPQAPAPETTALGAAPEGPAPERTPAAEPLVGASKADAPVDIGYAVRYERDPDFVPPPGVDIGDAMVIERDAPPTP